ncbi:MAG: hypothetical protein QXH30_00355 [Candidatus Bilamarchaeaceae archaeon]
MGKREELMEFLLLRHKEWIEAKEARLISRLRQIISPYSVYVSRIKAEILTPLAPYMKEEQFLDAVEKVIAHCSRIEEVELPVDYSLSFEEMESMKAGPPMDKCLLIASLLRAAGSESAAVVAGRNYPLVKFRHGGREYAINPRENRLLEGKEAEEYIANSKPEYIFNDLFFEVAERG